MIMGAAARCLAGRIDTDWRGADTKSAIAKFANLRTTPNEPTDGLLDALRGATARVCPLDCGNRQVEKNGQCVAKICPGGRRLTRDGSCEETRERGKTATRSPEPAARSRQTPVPGALREVPADGTISYGSRVLVDNGSCPRGQILELIGGSNKRGIPRQKRCIARN